MVDSSSPRYGERPATIRRCAWRPARWNGWNWRGTATQEHRQPSWDSLRERHSGRLNVIWDNAPAHRGEAVREYLRTPGLNLRLFNLPGYSPDFNADEAVWGWAREEATGNLCLGVQGQGAGAGRQLPRWSGQPERGGKTPLPHRLAIKGQRPAAGLPLQLSTTDMHIPPWLWFSCPGSVRQLAASVGRSRFPTASGAAPDPPGGHRTRPASGGRPARTSNIDSGSVPRGSGLNHTAKFVLP